MSATADSRQYQAGEIAADRVIRIMGIVAVLVGASDDRRYLYPIHDVSTTRRMGDRHDRRSLDGSAHRGGHQADLSKSHRASFYCCLPGVRLDNPSGDTTDARFGRCLDGGLDRSWRASSIPLRLVFTSGGRCPSRRQYGTASCSGGGELPLRSCSAWCGIGPIMRARLATISKRDAADRHEWLAEPDRRSSRRRGSRNRRLHRKPW